MTTASGISTDGRAFQTAFVLLLVGGWVILAKPQNLFSLDTAATETKISASAPVETKTAPVSRARKKKIPVPSVAVGDLSSMIAEANSRIGDGALALEKSGDGAELLTLQASAILLTDKNRPRISLAASEVVQPVLNAFVSSRLEQKKITIEASSDIPATHVRSLEKYLRSYKGWAISKVEAEAAGIFRVRIQEGK